MVLVQMLREFKSKGKSRPLRSAIAGQFGKHKEVYKKVGVQKFGEYIDLAIKLGIVETGGREPDSWISLNPRWEEATPSIK